MWHAACQLRRTSADSRNGDGGEEGRGRGRGMKGGEGGGGGEGHLSPLGFGVIATTQFCTTNTPLPPPPQKKSCNIANPVTLLCFEFYSRC